MIPCHRQEWYVCRYGFNLAKEGVSTRTLVGMQIIGQIAEVDNQVYSVTRGQLLHVGKRKALVVAGIAEDANPQREMISSG